MTILATSTVKDIKERALLDTAYWSGKYKLARALERRGAILDEDTILQYTIMRAAQERYGPPLIRGLRIRQQVPYAV